MSSSIIGSAMSEDYRPVESLRAKCELFSLGRKPKKLISYRRKMHAINVGQKIATGEICREAPHHLIDYRNGNQVILKKMLTRYEAAKKNRFLKNTGKAWARVGHL